MIPLPPENRSLSPHTGWTRAHWEAVADGLLAAVEPFRSPDGAEVNLPGRESWSRCDGMEGYARTFLLAAFRVAGGGDPAPLEPYARGLAAGPRVWQPVGDRTQSMVEAASIALGLWLTRPHLWDRLDGRTRAVAADYLSATLRHQPANSNWWLFPATVGGFLASAGLHTGEAEAAVRRGLARIEPWYAGDGWYSDGPGRAFDHYNGWALHLYPALLAHLSGRQAGVHGERLRDFLAGFALTFDADGGMLYHGRSLTYRFASVTALFAGALVDATPLAPGQTRRIASGVLRHFLDRGALSPDGLLTLGWYGPYEPALQPYSGWASPYWAAKAFLGLLLPPDHPVWTAPEEPGPTGTAALPGPGFLVRSSDGVATLVNHGSEKYADDPLYDRYAYSSRTAPTTAGAVPDNHFGTVTEDGTPAPRGPFTPVGAGTLDDVAWAASRSAGAESVSVLRGPVEVRIHRVAPGSRVRQTGWALPHATPADAAGPTDSADAAGPAGPAGPVVALRSPDGPETLLAGLHGYETAAAVEAPDGTAFGSPALVPVLDGVALDGWAVAVAVLVGRDPQAGPTGAGAQAGPTGAGAQAGPTGARAAGLPTARADGGRVLVTWPDGTAHAFTTDGPVTA
ncbi:DUF2264 domain-containing protein [Nonomuraea sp. NPDC047897]|uniref:DUF2264 domain-containing protein n=1 Tax=Nonomuraea sp. NPDC047897 TaxID=3364346 RepID=UPI003722F594